jgi:hypothetical protein
MSEVMESIQGLKKVNKFGLDKVTTFYLILSTLYVIFLGYLKISEYNYGREFNKPHFLPWVFEVTLPLILVSYVAATLLVIVGFFQKKYHFIHLFVILLLPAGLFFAKKMAAPTFQEGMKVGLLEQNVTSERFKAFAEKALQNPKDYDGYPASLLIKELNNTCKLFEAMRRLDLNIYDSNVELIFEGVWTKQECGVIIGKAPFAKMSAESLKVISYEEAMDGVWIYHHAEPIYKIYSYFLTNTKW